MHSPRTLLPLAAAALCALAAPAAAQAATDATAVTIAGGTLEYTTPLTADDFPNVTLDGAPKVVTADVAPYSVTDSRGGSAGWNLTIEASQFTNAGGDTLPAGSLRMALPPVPTKDVTANPLGLPPTVQATLDPIDGGSAQKIVSAAAVSLVGAGQWTFTPLPAALTLTVPGVAPPGTYTSTITTTLSTGP